VAKYLTRSPLIVGIGCKSARLDSVFFFTAYLTSTLILIVVTFGFVCMCAGEVLGTFILA